MAALCKSLSTLTLADQIANALANIAWEGLHEPNSLELASAALAQEEWQSCKEQPDPHDLVKERVIGEGGYSVVYLVRDVRTNRQFGLKRLRKGFMANLGLVERVLMEKEAHEELRHPFICHLYTTFQDADSLYFVLELARGGDLFELIELHGGQLSEPASRHYLGSVALGLQHMHTHGYVYRDLKPENVLIDGHGFVKIADLGYAKFVKGKRTFSSLGTVTYAPPELLGGRGRTKAADWWGCGVLLHEMLRGQAPFVGDTTGEVLRRVQLYAEDRRANAEMLRCLQKTDMSLEAADLIASLLQPNEKDRLGTSGFRPIQDHPWFAGFNWVALLRHEMTPPYIPPADCALPDVSDRVNPNIALQHDFDRERWASLFDQFGPTSSLHGE